MVSGREAFTLAEVKIAALVARGDSTSDIVRGMFLSRRTVQTYISRIITKLGAKSRVEIVGEALRQGISPERDGRCIAAKVSSYDHYSRPRLGGSIEECPARAQPSRVMDTHCDDYLTLLGEVDDDGEVPAGSSAGAPGA